MSWQIHARGRKEFQITILYCRSFQQPQLGPWGWVPDLANGYVALGKSCIFIHLFTWATSNYTDAGCFWVPPFFLQVSLFSVHFQSLTCYLNQYQFDDCVEWGGFGTRSAVEFPRSCRTFLSVRCREGKYEGICLRFSPSWFLLLYGTQGHWFQSRPGISSHSGHSEANEESRVGSPGMQSPSL